MFSNPNFLTKDKKTHFEQASGKVQQQHSNPIFQHIHQNNFFPQKKDEQYQEQTHLATLKL